MDFARLNAYLRLVGLLFNRWKRTPSLQKVGKLQVMPSLKKGGSIRMLRIGRGQRLEEIGVLFEKSLTKEVLRPWQLASKRLIPLCGY